MYVIERGTSSWLCTTAIEVFEVQAVQIRLRGKYRNFAEFERRLNNFEHIEAGVISIYKCSEVCKRYTDCGILQRVQETAQAHAEFAKWVKDNGGYTL